MHNTVQLTYIGGVDRFQFEGNQYSPNYLQYRVGRRLPRHVAGQHDEQPLHQPERQRASGRYTPGFKWFNSAQTSVGGTYETQRRTSYFVRQRGLTPTRQIADERHGHRDDATTSQEFRDQSHYVNEQIIALDEKLALSVGVRADRGSANGDREQVLHAIPKYSASYRFVEPLSFLTTRSTK